MRNGASSHEGRRRACAPLRHSARVIGAAALALTGCGAPHDAALEVSPPSSLPLVATTTLAPLEVSTSPPVRSTAQATSVATHTIGPEDDGGDSPPHLPARPEHRPARARRRPGRLRVGALRVSGSGAGVRGHLGRGDIPPARWRSLRAVHRRVLHDGDRHSCCRHCCGDGDDVARAVGRNVAVAGFLRLPWVVPGALVARAALRAFHVGTALPHHGAGRCWQPTATGSADHRLLPAPAGCKRRPRRRAQRAHHGRARAALSHLADRGAAGRPAVGVLARPLGSVDAASCRGWVCGRARRAGGPLSSCAR